MLALVALVFLQAAQSSEAIKNFIEWRSQQQLTGMDVFARYREHLKQQGLSDGQINAAFREIEKDRWNQVLTADKPQFNTKPNDFLVEMVKGRKPGAALDAGMGQGRNAIWLAQQGWNVTGFDPAEKAIALAQTNAATAGVKIKTEIAGTEEYNFGESQWDLILFCYVGVRGMTERVQRALKPGGLLVIEWGHADARRALGPRVGGEVFETGELPGLFPELRVVRYEEPIGLSDFFSNNQKARKVRYCGIKPSGAHEF